MFHYLDNKELLKIFFYLTPTEVNRFAITSKQIQSVFKRYEEQLYNFYIKTYTDDYDPVISFENKREFFLSFLEHMQALGEIVPKVYWDAFSLARNNKGFILDYLSKISTGVAQHRIHEVFLSYNPQFLEVLPHAFNMAMHYIVRRNNLENFKCIIDAFVGLDQDKRHAILFNAFKHIIDFLPKQSLAIELDACIRLAYEKAKASVPERQVLFFIFFIPDAKNAWKKENLENGVDLRNNYKNKNRFEMIDYIITFYCDMEEDLKIPLLLIANRAIQLNDMFVFWDLDISHDVLLEPMFFCNAIQAKNYYFVEHALKCMQFATLSPQQANVLVNNLINYGNPNVLKKMFTIIGHRIFLSDLIKILKDFLSKDRYNLILVSLFQEIIKYIHTYIEPGLSTAINYQLLLSAVLTKASPEQLKYFLNFIDPAFMRNICVDIWYLDQALPVWNILYSKNDIVGLEQYQAIYNQALNLGHLSIIRILLEDLGLMHLIAGENLKISQEEAFKNGHKHIQCYFFNLLWERLQAAEQKNERLTRQNSGLFFSNMQSASLRIAQRSLTFEEDALSEPNKTRKRSKFI